MAPEVSEQPAPHARRAGARLRMVVSAVLLAVLVTKIRPRGRCSRSTSTSRRSSSSSLGLLLTASSGSCCRRGAGSGCCASSTPPVPLGRSPSTTSPASSSATCCRRRSAATCCGSAGSAREHRLERDVRSPRSRSNGSAVSSRSRCSCFLGFVVEPVAARVDHAGSRWWSPAARSSLLGADPAARRAPAAWPAGSATTRTGCGSSARSHIGVDRCAADPRDALGILGTALVYQVSVVLTVGSASFHTLDARRCPTAAVIAFVPAVAMAQVVPISLERPRRARGHARAASCTRSASRPGRRIGIGLLWYLTHAARAACSARPRSPSATGTGPHRRGTTTHGA